MKKAIVSAVLIAILMGVGWRYASPRAREALLGFIGLASQSIQEGQGIPAAKEIRRALKGAAPDDPAERRQALAGELMRRVRELQRRDRTTMQEKDTALAAESAPDPTLASAATSDVLAGAAEIIKELEGVSEDESVGARAAKRILERLLPETTCRTE